MDWTPVLTAVSAFLVAIIGGLGAYIVARLKKETTKQEVEELKLKQTQMEKQIKDVQIQASLQHLYTKCENCGHEIDLSKAEIYTKDSEEEKNDNNK